MEKTARLATYSVTALAAAIVVVCFSRAETAQAPNAVVYLSPTGEERRIHQALEELLESAKREVEYTKWWPRRCIVDTFRGPQAWARSCRGPRPR